MKIKKQIVHDRFKKRAESYDAQAIVQRKVANLLANFILDKHKVFSRILEVGCGTGFLTKSVFKQAKVDTYFLNDIVDYQDHFAEMFQQCTGLNYLKGDVEHLKFPDNLDLLLSSSTIQWLEDLASFLKKSYQSLKKGGVFAIATFGELNYVELSNLLGIRLDYCPAADLKKLVGSFFTIDTFYSYEDILYFETPKAVLRHIQKIGVNAITDFKFTRGKLEHFETAYEAKFKTEKGFSLTYHPIILIARKQ